MTSLSDALRMRDLAYKMWGKKDISITNAPPRQAKCKTGTCWRQTDKEGQEYFVIYLYQYAGLKTIAHELAHPYHWPHGMRHSQLTEELYQTYLKEQKI